MNRFSFSFKFAKVLPIFLLSVFFLACDEDDNDNVIEGTNSIINYLSKNQEFSQLTELIFKADYQGKLDGNSGNYTFLAPTNQAISEFLTKKGVNDLSALTQQEAQEIIDYHLLLEKVDTSQATTGFLTTAAQLKLNDSVSYPLSLHLKKDTGLSFNASAQLLQANIEVDNGVLHVLNEVLIIPSLADLLSFDEQSSGFYTFWEELGLLPLLEREELQSLFAPETDKLATFLQNENLDAQERELIAKNHLYQGFLHTDAITLGYRYSEANRDNNKISNFFNTNTGILINNKASVSTQNIVGKNGVMHICSDILALPSLWSLIESNPNLTTFVIGATRTDSALSDYKSLLSGTNNINYTCFIPNNAAFNTFFSNQDATGMLNIDNIDAGTLEALLMTHLFENTALKIEDLPSSVTNNQGVITINKSISFCKLTDENGMEASVIEQDINSKNGFVHTIDSVLLNN